MAHAQSAEVASIGRSRILCIDVGGSGLKAAVADQAGDLLTERVRVDTPVGSRPDEMVETLARLVAPLGAYDCVSVGFPGVVRNGRVLTAPNLDNKGWKNFALAAALEKALSKPVRVANDADVYGLGVISGKGVEMIITLGTGFGTGLYVDGRLGPHMELSHHEFRKGETYDEQLGNATRKAIGNKKWNKRVRRAIKSVRSLTSFDHLYIGGGNADKITFALDRDVTIVPN
ncbi:MAG TPA: ROK family protein, partial [Gemmatimonadaceae bacterium]